MKKRNSLIFKGFGLFSFGFKKAISIVSRDCFMLEYLYDQEEEHINVERPKSVDR